MGFLRGGALGLGLSLLAVSAPAQQPSPSPAAACFDTLEQEIYQDAPGGHAFNRIDTPLAKESRKEIYAFLARYLK